MKQTIIAILHPNNYKEISDKEFLKQASREGNIFTLKQFEIMWNKDEIEVKAWVIRVLEVDSKFKLV